MNECIDAEKMKTLKHVKRCEIINRPAKVKITEKSSRIQHSHFATINKFGSVARPLVEAV